MAKGIEEGGGALGRTADTLVVLKRSIWGWGENKIRSKQCRLGSRGLSPTAGDRGVTRASLWDLC